jgi:hypothetical protein
MPHQGDTLGPSDSAVWPAQALTGKTTMGPTNYLQMNKAIRCGHERDTDQDTLCGERMAAASGSESV